MKVTKEYLRKLIKESLKEATDNQTIFVIEGTGYGMGGPAGPAIRTAHNLENAMEIAEQIFREADDAYEVDINIYKVSLSDSMIVKKWRGGMESGE